MKPIKLHKYQQQINDRIMQRLFFDDEKGMAIFLDPGLGKTLQALYFFDFMRAFDNAKRALVICPKPVIVYETWQNEIKKWAFDMEWDIISGTALQRLRAMRTEADIHLMNPENVDWFMQQPDRQQYDLLVIDESDRFKNWSSQCTRALRKMQPDFRKVLAMTGTPVPNKLGDIFPQIFMCDGGESLGRSVTRFRREYMRRGGYQNYDWVMREDKIDQLKRAIKHIAIHADAESHLDMPELVYNEISVTLPPKIQKVYKALEKEMYAEVGEGEDLEKIIAKSAGGNYMLCRQVANGGAYLSDEDAENKRAIHVHDAKTSALKNLIAELQGKPLIVAYQYNHDRDRIIAALGKKLWTRLKAKVIDGNTPDGVGARVLDEFRAGQMQLLVAQCATLSHGIDGLQNQCNDICWFGLTDKPGVWNQFNRRIYRQGVNGQVRIHMLLAKGTLDRKVLRRLREKEADQSELLQAISI